MKRIHVLLAALGLVFVVSSCKNTMDLTKRRYTKGYHFEKHTAPSTPEEGVASQKQTKAATMEPIAQSMPASESEKREVSGGLKENVAVQSLSSGETEKSETQLTQKEEKSSNTLTALKKAAVQQSSKVQKKGASTAKGGSSDANLILMVILCLFPFINLIPVYLHDGKSATANLWVTLLLDVLFFLPGIIFAILVVLDVVDLS